MYHLDDSTRELRIVNYPVILNGVIVSVLEVYEDIYTHKMSWQAGPQLANQTFSGSDIGTVWKNYYILDKDHEEHKEVDTKLIPMKEVTKGIVVNVMEPLCTERTANWAEVM